MVGGDEMKKYFPSWSVCGMGVLGKIVTDRNKKI
jgi:hypothetical protein